MHGPLFPARACSGHLAWNIKGRHSRVKSESFLSQQFLLTTQDTQLCKDWGRYQLYVTYYGSHFDCIWWPFGELCVTGKIPS